MYAITRVKSFDWAYWGFYVELYSYPLGYVVAMKTPYSDWKGIDCICYQQADDLYQSYIEMIKNRMEFN